MPSRACPELLLLVILDAIKSTVRTNQDTGLVLSDKDVPLYTQTYGGREWNAEIFRDG